MTNEQLTKIRKEFINSRDNWDLSRSEAEDIFEWFENEFIDKQNNYK